MFESVLAFFSTESFMPHGHCYLWQPSLVFLQVTTNGLIGLAYVSIAVTLAYLVYRVEDIPFKWVYICFCVFIISCGFTHFFNIYVIWNPSYWWDAALRSITAIASVGTALLLFPLVPKALALAKGANEAHQRGIELESVVRDLGTMYEKTRELDELKSQLFANISHELRTPLALIQSPAEKLLQAENLSDEQRCEVQIILRNSRIVLRQVNDLLDVATTEAGEMRVEYVDVDAGKFVRRVASNFEVLAEERDITFEVAAPSELRAELDLEKMERVLINLLSNAFKFTSKEGTIRCSLSTGEAEVPNSGEAGGKRKQRRKPEIHRVLVFEVADSGPGIAPEHRHFVFERFQQIEGGKTRRFGGTGLGLAIVREFTELLRGTISVDTAPEGGALFRVEIPINAPSNREVEAKMVEESPSAMAQQIVEELRVPTLAEMMREKQVVDKLVGNESTADESAPKSESGQPFVLVVEDNREMNLYIADALNEKFQVMTAFEGSEGLESAIEHRPDLIITDIMMPRMSGDEMIIELQERAELEHIPIIVLTAKADEKLRVELLKRGAMDYLNKPFSSQELVARASNLVAIKRVGDTLRDQLRSKNSDIEQLARQLAEKIRQLELTLDTVRVAREQAETASRGKSNFLALVSHELRTPLSSIKLYVDLLRRGEEDFSENQRDVLKRVDNNILRLTNIVESLLQQASFESGRITEKSEHFDLSEETRDSLQLYQYQAEQKGLDLRLRLASKIPTIESDPHLIRLAIGNLVTNAIKFTEEGFIEVGVDYDIDEEVYKISVRDSGPGIPAEEKTRIFQPFEHLEKIQHKRTAGLGLGLALTHQLVETLGGHIELRSEVGKGSTFTIVIPRRRN